MNEGILIAKADTHPLFLLPEFANRHGLIAGATGTGKTVSLQVLAEGFSNIGVPVFMADIKGDLSGLGKAGTANPKIQDRLERLGIKDFAFAERPVVFWDVFGEQGHPVRATISDMGPLLMSRLLGLNETQSGVLQIVFRVADDNGWLLLDLKDLRALVQEVGDNSEHYRTTHGNVSTASIGAVQRALLSLEEQGGDKFFGEPALDFEDLMQTDQKGRGVINLLSAEKLMQSPGVYSTFLLWLLSELFEHLPEVGDIEKPKLVFFFDEAHLLFDEAPKALVQKIEQVVRLIRSKGIGVFFVSQNPLDIPDEVLGQLGNRIQHALRAFTPRDQKAVNAAAETFRENLSLDVRSVITELGVGEALVSFLDKNGIPQPVERALICPPQAQIGPLTVDERKTFIRQSVLFGHYEENIDRESAYEKLRARAERSAETGQPEVEGHQAPSSKKSNGNASGGGRPRQSVMEAFIKSAARSVGSRVGTAVVRGILGSIMGGSRK